MPARIASGLQHRSLLRLLAWALLTCGAANAAAESGAYRIEVLVFRHETGAATLEQTRRISSFPGAWQLDAPRATIIPEDPAPLGVMSDRMRGIWRRLENSGEYTPLLFRAWEQSRIDYQPPVRLHDDELLLERIEPPAERRSSDPEADADAVIPYRHLYYRLDGTAQLRRTRFLHLSLDLEYRSRIHNESGLATDPSPSLPARIDEVEATPAASQPLATLHQLKESRQVRIGDLLYFDTPYLGVLARVTETAGE